MRYFLISLLCAALSINLTAAENSAIVEQELQRLDSIVAKADVFIARKKSHIENIGKSVASAMTNDDLITIYDHIYDEYRKFDSVSAMKDFKREIYNLITAGKYDRARKSLTSNELTDEYLKTFYAQFDRAFLLAHPDFLDRFNALLKPDKQIWPAEPGRLTPELRIYALVSMGISDSIRIAEFLQYSPQTIYNYRLRVRHSACISEKEFAPTVERFYLHD